jgi:hypothetical protein
MSGLCPRRIAAPHLSNISQKRYHLSSGLWRHVLTCWDTIVSRGPCCFYLKGEDGGRHFAPWRHNPEQGNLTLHRHENLKSLSPLDDTPFPLLFYLCPLLRYSIWLLGMANQNGLYRASWSHVHFLSYHGASATINHEDTGIDALLSLWCTRESQKVKGLSKKNKARLL